jgi:hypothetical protein
MQPEGFAEAAFDAIAFHCAAHRARYCEAKARSHWEAC